MVSVATARRVANRIAAVEPEERPPEPSVPRENLSGLADVESQAALLEGELTEARDNFDKAALRGSERADHFRRTLTDAKVATGLSRVELAQKNIIPAWLRRFAGWLSDYPTRLEDTGRALVDGVDIVETVHGGWRKLKKKLTDAVYSSLREFADDLRGLGRRLGERRRTTAPVEPFSISKVRSKILAGEAPHTDWVRFIDELDLSHAALRELAPVQTLTALQSLDLSRTQVSDLSPLRALTALQSLDLSGTPVRDLFPSPFAERPAEPPASRHSGFRPISSPDPNRAAEPRSLAHAGERPIYFPDHERPTEPQASGHSGFGPVPSTGSDRPTEPRPLGQTSHRPVPAPVPHGPAKPYPLGH